MIEIFVVLCACSPVRDPDDTAHVLGGSRVEQPQTENRIGLMRQAQREPGMLLLQRRLLLLDERVVTGQRDDGSVCFLKSYQPLVTSRK